MKTRPLFFPQGHLDVLPRNLLHVQDSNQHPAFPFFKLLSPYRTMTVDSRLPESSSHVRRQETTETSAQLPATKATNESKRFILTYSISTSFQGVFLPTVQPKAVYDRSTGKGDDQRRLALLAFNNQR